MAKLKELWNGEHKGFFRYAAVITAVTLVFIIFISNDGVVRWVKSVLELRRQGNEIESLRRENEELDRKIQLLSSDRDSLERFARETFFFAAPQEDVFIVDEGER